MLRSHLGQLQLCFRIIARLVLHDPRPSGLLLFLQATGRPNETHAELAYLGFGLLLTVGGLRYLFQHSGQFGKVPDSCSPRVVGMSAVDLASVK